jgi:hypothetical protein
MPPRFVYWLGLWGGAIVTGGLLSLYQDYLGREGYAQHVLEHWSPASHTVPEAICTLLVFVFITALVWRRTRPTALRAPAPSPIEPIARSMYVIAPSVGDEKITLVTERVGRAPDRMEFSVRAATDLALLFGQAVQAARGDSQPMPKPDPTTRPTAWEKIDLLDD